MGKQAEEDFASMCALYNIWAHKWDDVTTCGVCGSLIHKTKRVDGNDGRTVRASIVDYLIFVGNKPLWVECKGRLNTTNFPFSEIELHQRQFLHSWQDKGVDCALFLIAGLGKAPNRKAWFIPWSKWDEIEASLAPRKSLPWSASLYNYRLIWERGGWKIPFDTWFANAYPDVFCLPSLYEKEYV